MLIIAYMQCIENTKRTCAQTIVTSCLVLLGSRSLIEQKRKTQLITVLTQLTYLWTLML